MSKLPSGYTLVELLVTIAIIAVLIASGISAFARSRDSQQIASASQTILSALASAQQKAQIGDKDCTGIFLGQRVTVTSGSNTLTTQALCQSESGTPKAVELAGITFAGNYSLTFRPLVRGVDFSTGGNTLDLDFVASGSTYRIQIDNSGTFTYKGKQP